jgi:hypothetical protein
VKPRFPLPCMDNPCSNVSRGEGRMNFIERYLGISPDGGDGSFEAILLTMLLMIITGIALRFTAHRGG